MCTPAFPKRVNTLHVKLMRSFLHNHLSRGVSKNLDGDVRFLYCRSPNVRNANEVGILEHFSSQVLLPHLSEHASKNLEEILLGQSTLLMNAIYKFIE